MQNRIVSTVVSGDLCLCRWWTEGPSTTADGHHLAIQEQMEATYRVRMQLTVSHFRGSDNGRYVCQAKNSLFEAEEAIQTYGNGRIDLLVS